MLCIWNTFGFYCSVEFLENVSSSLHLRQIFVSALFPKKLSAFSIFVLGITLKLFKGLASFLFLQIEPYTNRVCLFL